MTKTKNLTSYLLAGLLLLAYQYSFDIISLFVDWRPISDAWYATAQLVIYSIIALLAYRILVSYMNWRELLNFRFNWKKFGILFFTVLSSICWSYASAIILGPSQNGQAYSEAVPTFTGITVFLMVFFYPLVLAPICEEIIYRGLVMNVFKRWRMYGVDVIVSATLFSLLHVLSHSWSFYDFLSYFGGGLILAISYRWSQSLAWTIGAHVIYNGFVLLLMFR